MKKGFTLVELLVVMAVLAVLAGGLIVAINPLDKINAANDAKVQNDISQISAALVAYAAGNNGSYPTAAQGLNALVTNGDLTVVPAAPTGYTAYAYTPTCGATCTDARLSGQLKSKKYVNPNTAFWNWCASTAKAGPVATATTCP